jgi:hypothetical protein
MKNLFKTIIYGDPGVGKTVLLGSVTNVPELCPAILLDFEGNTDSIESKCHYLTKLDDEPDPTKLNVYRLVSGVTKLPSFTKKGELRNPRIDAMQTYEEALNYLLSAKHPYKTIMLDSLTEQDYWALNWIIERFPIKRVHDDVPDKPDYRKLLTLQTDIFIVLRDCPYHVFVTCHTQTDEKTGKITPKLNGQLRTVLPGLFKQTALLRVANEKRILHFQPYGNYECKDCTEGGLMGDKVTEPTLSKLYNLRYKQ